MTLGKAVFGRNKKGAKNFFPKKIRGRLFPTKKGAKTFFDNNGGEDFIPKK